jgi:DNA-directed RNA polymerase V subunit 1
MSLLPAQNRKNIYVLPFFFIFQSVSHETLGGYDIYDFLGTVETLGATEEKTVIPHSSCLYDVDHLPEDEVACLGGSSSITWTDKPKVDYLQRDFERRRNGICSTAQEYQGMQTKSNWNSDAKWKNNEPSWRKKNAMGPRHSIFARSTNTSGCNKRHFAGQVFERKQPKHNWNSAATRKDEKPCSFREDVAGTQNFSIPESSAPGGWDRKNSTFGRGGSTAMWKSEGSNHGGSNSRNWKTQKNSSARQGGSYNFTPVEQQIYAQVDPIMKNARRIICESRYISWLNARD